MRGRPILVVDDDAATRDAVECLLRMEGYDVVAAQDGDQALVLLRQVHPSVVILDLNLPMKHGWAFRAAQRRDPELSAIPVIAMTGLDDPWYHARDLGLRDFVKKPVDADRLLRLVSGHCLPQ